MSLDFNGSNSLVTGPATFTQGSLLTWFAWIYPRSAGEASEGTIFAHGTSGSDPRAALLFYPAGNRLFFFASWSTTKGYFLTPVDSIELGRWQSVAVNYSFVSTSNVPAILIDGKQVPVTVLQAPVGTPQADTQPLYAGSLAGGGTTFDGLIAQWAVFNTVMTIPELAKMHYRGPLAMSVLPDLFGGALTRPDPLKVYWPMRGPTANATDFSGHSANGTLANLAAGPEPVMDPQILALAADRLIPASARFRVRRVRHDPATARLTYVCEEL